MNKSPCARAGGSSSRYLYHIHDGLCL